ncbi:hypothetical protein TWF696_003039 [Orbilia brochopaga]|uniref:Uncharacterized protein n=1 Tax=Orbilia brochopaga TaxID=3140254 RepID=A0AAV9U0Q1_9PEZI
MPCCYKVWYPECRRTLLTLLNDAYAEKDTLPSPHDPNITPEQVARLAELRREIRFLYADARAVLNSRNLEGTSLLWLR